MPEPIFLRRPRGRPSIVMVVGIALLLAACGGGGGGKADKAEGKIRNAVGGAKDAMRDAARTGVPFCEECARDGVALVAEQARDGLGRDGHQRARTRGSRAMISRSAIRFMRITAADESRKIPCNTGRSRFVSAS